jgi:hypothetical protein
MNLPTGSKKAIPNIYDTLNANPMSDVTAIGQDDTGTAISGQWLCHFIYDGSEYIWTIGSGYCLLVVRR